MQFNESSREILTHSCHESLPLWLMVYSIHMTYIVKRFSFPIFMLVFHVRFFLTLRSLSNNHEELPDVQWNATTPHYLYALLQFVLQQIVLTIVYVVAASIWTLVMSAAPISSMTLARWWIEASHEPLQFLVVILAFCTLPPDYDVYYEFLSITRPALFSIKVTQFIAIRYAELHSDAWLNNNLVKIFYQLCDTPDRRFASSERPHWIALLDYYEVPKAYQIPMIFKDIGRLLTQRNWF